MDHHHHAYLSRLAGGFAKTTGLEFDDLYQHARMAYWQAEHDDRYDPRKAGLNTFCSLCTYNQLCSYAAKQQRQAMSTEPLDPAMPEERRPSQEDTVYFRELVRALPDDAKTIIQLIFDAADDVPPGRMRDFIRDRLRRIMTKVRIESAFGEIKTMLRSATG